MFLSRKSTISKFAICTISPWQEAEMVLYQKFATGCPCLSSYKVTFYIIFCLSEGICTVSPIADGRKSCSYLGSTHNHYFFFAWVGSWVNWYQWISKRALYNNVIGFWLYITPDVAFKQAPNVACVCCSASNLSPFGSICSTSYSVHDDVQYTVIIGGLPHVPVSYGIL